MTTMMTTIKKWQDDYVSLVARLEEPVVRFAVKASESVAEYVPERPDWAFLAEVPAMNELVDNQLKFRKRVVDEQAAFVRKLMKAMHPVLIKLDPKPAELKHPITKRSVAKRSVAKRPVVRRIGVTAA